MQSLKQLAGQTAIYGLSSIIGRFLNYLLTPLYTYQFATNEFGVMTEMYAYVAFLIVLLTFGMETSFFRFASRSNHPKDVFNTAFMPVASFSAAFVLTCLLLSDTIAGWILYPDHPEYVIWFAIIVGLDAISSLPLAKLRHQNRAIRFAWINLTSIGVNIGLNLFFIFYCKINFDQGNTNSIIDLCYNPEIGIGYIFIANLVASIIKTLLLLPNLTGISFRIDPVLLRKMVLYALPLLIAGIAGIANEQLDKLLLKYLLLAEHDIAYTMSQVGIYGACYKVSILITLFIQSYRYAAEPFFFNKSKDEDAKQVYADMMKYFVIACLLIFLFLMVNIDLVMLFVGEDFREGAPVVPILLLANIFLGIYYNLSVWYKLTDKTIVGAYISIGGALVTIAMNIILIPTIGYLGSAWATLACYTAMATTSFLLGRKSYKIPYPIRKIVVYSALVLGTYALSLSLDLQGGMKWTLNNAFFLLIAGIIIFLEKPKKIII